MSTIPDSYKGAGYGTIYSETELRQAIANAEVLAKVGGTDGTPITAATIPPGGVGVIGWLSGIWYAFVRPAIIDIAGVISTTGDNTIIASPGVGLSIYVTRLMVQNESSALTTIILKDSGNKLRIVAASQGDGIALPFPERREIKLAANTPLILNLSGANSVGYSIGYYTGT